MKPLFTITQHFGYKQILSFLMVLSIFVNHSKIGYLGLFDYYWYYPVFVLVILVALFKKGLGSLIRNRYNLFLILLCAIGLISIWVQPYGSFHLMKQLAGWAFFGWAWLAIFEIQDKNYRPFMQMYLTVAIIAAFLTIPEQILHISGIHITPKKGAMLGMYRCFSIVDEPFPLAMLLLPWIIFYLEKGKERSHQERWYLAILLIGFIFTFSGGAWLVLLLYPLYRLIRKPKWVEIIASGLILILGLSLLFFYHGTRLRVIESVSIFQHFPELPEGELLNQTNSSSRAIYLNSVAAYHNFLQNPVTGGGLGSQYQAYQTHVANILDSREMQTIHLNQFDGASGFIRIISETGLIGFFLLISFLYSVCKYSFKELRLPILFFWLCILIHSGNYFHYGTVMWIVMICFVLQRKTPTI